MSSTEKKKMSKKKKILIIVLCVLLAFVAAVVGAGVYALNWYCTDPEFTVTQTAEEVNLIAHRGFRAVAPENTRLRTRKREKQAITAQSVIFTEPPTVCGCFITTR